MTNTSMAAALETLQLERSWISTLLNHPFTENTLNSIVRIFEAIDANTELNEQDTQDVRQFLQGIVNCAYEICLFGKISDVDSRRFSHIILIFYNLAGMLEMQNLQNSLRSIQSLIERSFSFMEILDLIQQIAKKLAPLLGQTSVEASASQLFLKSLDRHYADLREESKQ